MHVEGTENQLRVLEEVRAHGPESVQADRLEQHLRTVRPDASVDAVSARVWDDVKQVLSDGAVADGTFEAVGARSSGEPGAKVALAEPQAPARQRMLRVAEVLGDADLEVTATNDVYWDAIKSVTPAGVEEVYDATVMGLHNFVANGIAMHNSIEQDADMVVLLHREDAYEKESTRPGEADVIVAKHRNGPTRDIVVAFQGHYSRFVDMAH